jgi:hypothetical protein
LGLNYRRGLEGRKSPSYSKLNKKGILAPTILSGFMTSKLALMVLTRRKIEAIV